MTFLQKFLTLVGRVVYWIGWPVWHVLLKNSRRSRIFVVSDDEVLLVRPYLGSGAWGLPGGGMRRAEDPKNGAARELFEEVGICVRPEQLVDLGEHKTSYHGHSYLGYFYALRLQKKPTLKIQLHEIAGGRWFPLDVVEKIADQPSLRLAFEAWQKS
ncbi:MAG: NUDIX hydrolase [Candidatus Saccharimonadales bacterium]